MRCYHCVVSCNTDVFFSLDFRLESLLVQYEVAECVIKCDDAELFSQLRSILERNNIAWQKHTAASSLVDPLDLRLDVLNELRDLACPVVDNDGTDVQTQLNTVRDCTIEAVQMALQHLDLWKNACSHRSYEVDLGEYK